MLKDKCSKNNSSKMVVRLLNSLVKNSIFSCDQLSSTRSYSFRMCALLLGWCCRVTGRSLMFRFRTKSKIMFKNARTCQHWDVKTRGRRVGLGMFWRFPVICMAGVFRRLNILTLLGNGAHFKRSCSPLSLWYYFNKFSLNLYNYIINPLMSSCYEFWGIIARGTFVKLFW